MQDRDTRAPVFRTSPDGAPDVFAAPPRRSELPIESTAGANVFAPPAPAPATESAVDAAAIMASVGEVPYCWDIASDALTWGGDAAGLIKAENAAALSSGRAYAKLLDPATTASRFDAVMKSSQRDDGRGVAYQLQYALRAGPDGAVLWIEDTGRWFADASGKPSRAHGVVRTINERHEQEERLAFLSRFDSLTGEMNRWRLAEVLQATMDETARQRGSCGFMLVAIDNLSRLNEAYGFDVADEVIGSVAKRLRAKMRGGDEIGRFSGNKFGVILNNCGPEDMERAAERFLAGVRDDVIRTAAGPVAATVTIGGVTAPRHARSVQEILARAQETLERAKAKRRGSFQVYRPNVERDAMRRENVRSGDEIVAALNERRVVLAFEPAVDAATRKPAFYECLLRIKRADGSLLKANDVIPVAERLGLVRLLDHRVLELLIGEMAAVPGLHASVNVSPASTVDPDWWSALDALLRAHSGVAERLIVEITEMAAIQDLDDTRGFVSRVKDRGCRIAIDDFGAGYTSFRNLRKLGVDLLKIDGAFVRNVAQSEDDRAFVRTLIDLARRLGLKTVAEWVQDEHAAQILEAWGCDHLQGALIGLGSVERPWGTVAPVDRRKSMRP
ncbi:MAG: bifunctional diguanylate cyclase/phosphodiesterase [Alphaproteobacteria bacterium]|nr:bifunctional diguanylate cyclase/phosphodiesterase [Alphaproteobacteria bacterium]